MVDLRYRVLVVFLTRFGLCRDIVLFSGLLHHSSYSLALHYARAP